MTAGKSSFGVPPVERAIALLRYIADGNDCANTSLAAKETGINRTTLLRLVETLHRERMIQPNPNGAGYTLGNGLIHLAAHALHSRDIVQIAQPEIKSLAASLGLSTHLGVIEGLDILYLLRETPNLHLVSNVRVGSRLPVHATSIGRIILAYMDKDQRDIVLENCGFQAATPKTPTDRATLDAQLEIDRKTGLAWSVGNFEAGIGSAAAAVFDNTGQPVAAVNVTGPEREFAENAGRRDEIQTALIACAQGISQQLGFRTDSHENGINATRPR